jgi:hypothetical protein
LCVTPRHLPHHISAHVEPVHAVSVRDSKRKGFGRSLTQTVQHTPRLAKTSTMLVNP